MLVVLPGKEVCSMCYPTQPKVQQAVYFKVYDLWSAAMQPVIKDGQLVVLSDFVSMSSAIFVTIRFYSGLSIPIPF